MLLDGLLQLLVGLVEVAFAKDLGGLFDFLILRNRTDAIGLAPERKDHQPESKGDKQRTQLSHVQPMTLKFQGEIPSSRVEQELAPGMLDVSWPVDHGPAVSIRRTFPVQQVDPIRN